jgi:hypothetical protein
LRRKAGNDCDFNYFGGDDQGVTVAITGTKEESRD